MGQSGLDKHLVASFCQKFTVKKVVESVPSLWLVVFQFIYELV